jgi:transglutaminase-like putative cysteine protease
VIYRVRHRTTYTYDNEVTYARCVLRLKPQSSAGQALLDNAIVLEPAPSESVARRGPFGEHTLTTVIETPHDTLVVEANSIVDVSRDPFVPLEASESWEQVRDLALQSSEIGPESPATYLYPSARVQLSAALTDYARPSFAPGRPMLEAAAELMQRIHQDFTYDSEATTVSTPSLTAFAARRGVCQDFAHVMIGALRGLGLPAAYVSGYLRTISPPGEQRLIGADATHAWVSVWAGLDTGWVGLDPTNDTLVVNDHIALARGRDYSDVAPISGIMLASGDQAIKVEVDVIPQPGLSWPPLLSGGRLEPASAAE